MKYLYSRSLAGPPEPTPKPKKRTPKKQAAPKPKPQPQTPKPQTPVRATTNFNGQQPAPLPSPSQLKNSISNHTAGVRQSNQTSTPAVTSNPIRPPTSTPNAPTHSIDRSNNIPQEKRNDKENTNKSINVQQTTGSQSTKVVKQIEPVKRPELEKEVHKPSSSKSTEKNTVTDPKKKTVSTQKLDEPTSRTRLSKKAKLSLSFQEDPIEESQSNELSKREASTTSRTRSTNTIKEKEKTSSTPGRVGRPPASKPIEKKQPAKRGRKRIIESETESEEEDDLPQPRKRATKSRRPNKELPILNDTYKLSMVFQGHTDINIPAKSINDDDLTDAKDIWCCEFEPPRKGQLIHNVVAICGSYSVLLLDTQQGRYIKKYTHAEIQEIFYCMAWTTLTGPELLNNDVNEDESCNILAVAGRLGSIKLLNPLQNECYRYLFGHNQAVLKLAFAKAEPRWLFSASADKTVRLWDIGSPTSKDDDSVCLAKFNLPPKTSVPSALHISHDLLTLLVGFDDGDMVSFKITPQLLEKFRTKSASLRTKESRTGDKWHDFGPIATIDPKTTYPKGEEWHAGYIDDIYIFGQDGDKSNRLYNKILSRGAEDMEFIIWDPVKSTKSDADILVALEWPESAGCTGARFKVIEAEGQTVLIAGEYDGQVYIYNIGDMKNSKTLSDGSLEQYKPTRMLSHPMSSELIRDVCCSHDTRTIVAVDNNNTAFIWNCTDNNN